MGYTVLATGLVLIIVAWACYQYPNIINPYGNLPPERKELVDIEGLKKACAIILGITGFLLVVLAALFMLKVIDEDICATLLMVFAFAMLIPLFIAMKRYNGFGRDSSGKVSKYSRNSKIALISTGISILIVAVVLILSFRPTKISVEEEHIKISGMYGREIPIADIVSVELLDEMPPIAMRTNGSDTGNQAKGHFRFSNGESCMLFIHKKAPYIQLRTTNDLYYLNLSDKEQTVELFETIKSVQP